MVIAAPSSGSGKTTVATGLAAALAARGERVAACKIGPDYIDPGYHALATGMPGRNLDPVLVGEHRIGPLLAHGAAGADVAVIEGVMGLFDGRAGTAGLGSTAHVARLTASPVVLVVDARGQGYSLAALLHGFRSFDATVRLAGVVLNRVGSPRHVEMLTEAAADAGLPVLGAMPREPALIVPSRHLGLVTAAERASEAVAAVAAMRDVVAAHVDLDALRDIAAAAAPLAETAWDPETEVSPVGGRPVVAVAGGKVFSFGYREHVELLRAAGAKVVTLDPLTDEALPERTAGLVLPGGFPEVHAEELASNVTLRSAIARFARHGGPIHAECGGLLYLSRELDGEPMCGVLDARGSTSDRLTLGYRDAVAASESPLHEAGSRLTGHEFHRTTIEPGCRVRAAWHWRGSDGAPVSEGFVHHRVHASYLHTHPAGNPAAIGRFLKACAA